METKGLMDRPPIVATAMTPLDIIGPSNMRLFVDFLNVARSASNGGEFPHKRLAREIGGENLKMISMVLDELRAHGYYPGRVDDKGKIWWKVVVKSPVQELMEAGMEELQGKRISELQDIARSGYRKMVRKERVAANAK